MSSPVTGPDTPVYALDVEEREALIPGIWRQCTTTNRVRCYAGMAIAAIGTAFMIAAPLVIEITELTISTLDKSKSQIACALIGGGIICLGIAVAGNCTSCCCVGNTDHMSREATMMTA
jgi:hypothetical protein